MECDRLGIAWDFEVIVTRYSESKTFTISCSKKGLLAGGLEGEGKDFSFSLLKCWITCWETGELEDGELLLHTMQREETESIAGVEVSPSDV